MKIKEENLAKPKSVLRSFHSSLEEGLQNNYRIRFESGEFGSLLVCFVKNGSFNRVLEDAVENGAPANQI